MSSATVPVLSTFHQRVLQWLRDHSCDWTPDVYAIAATEGNIEIIQWAHKNRVPFDRRLCENAAYGGHFAILEWAMANDGSQYFDENVCYRAADGGHLEILQWLRANCCPWNSTVLHVAMAKGHNNILEWCVEMNCPGVKDIIQSIEKNQTIEAVTNDTVITSQEEIPISNSAEVLVAAENPDNMVYLFSYGSNSTRQIAERLERQYMEIVPIDAYLQNHVRIFAGVSTKWDGGGIASIYPKEGENVYGIAVRLRQCDLDILDRFERSYKREMRDIILQHTISNTTNETVSAYVYIRENQKFVKEPAERYLRTIHEMLQQRKRKTANPTIMIRKLRYDKHTTTTEDGKVHYHWTPSTEVVTIGKWSVTN
jgi:hypothetical protein